MTENGSPSRTVAGDVIGLVREYGVDTVFGIPGTHNLEFYRHVDRLGLRAVTTRHEQGAGYAADGWSQQTGLPGVVVTTSGPGLLNVLSSAATAYAESRPMLILSPGAPRGSVFGVGALHETKDPVGSVGAIVAWSRRAESGTEAIAAIHDAFALFASQRPRPVHVEIPLDVLDEGSSLRREVPNGPSSSPEPTPLRAAPDACLSEAAELLAAANAPVILAGGGAKPAAAALRALAERLDAPVLTTVNGKGTLPESHPLSVGAELRLPSARAFLEEADAVLVVGSKVGEAETWFEDLRPRGRVVRIDLDDRQLELNLATDVAIHADTRTAVPSLLDALTATATTRGHDGAERVRALRDQLRAESHGLAPALVDLADDVAAALPADAIVSGDSSQITYCAATSSVRVEAPGSFLYMPTYATLGYGLPAAIGAKLAAPDRPVLCLIGDGALMFSVQELITAAEQGLDLVVVCVDNGGYGEIKQNELDRDIPPIGVDLRQPDWPGLADSLGGHGARVTEGSELTGRIEAAFAAGGVRLLHVPMELYTSAAAPAERRSV